MTAKPSNKTIDMQIASAAAGMTGKHKIEVFTVTKIDESKVVFLFPVSNDQAEQAFEIIDTHPHVAEWISQFVIRTNTDDCSTIEALCAELDK